MFEFLENGFLETNQTIMTGHGKNVIELKYCTYFTVYVTIFVSKTQILRKSKFGIFLIDKFEKTYIMTLLLHSQTLAMCYAIAQHVHLYIYTCLN